MLQTHPTCLPPPSPRSTTTSWVRSTAHFVSGHNEQISASSPQVHNLQLSSLSFFFFFFFVQVYCPSWATASCYLLHITSDRPWSQRSSSSLISPSVTLGWRSLYSHWQYRQLFHTGASYFTLRFISPICEISNWFLWEIFFDCNLQLFWRFRSFLSCSCYPVSPLCIFVIWISLDFLLLVGQNKPSEEFTLSLRNFLAAYRQNKESNNQEMSLFSLCTGGCLERSPVSSMLCVEYCLVYAAWPTSQLSP